MTMAETALAVEDACDDLDKPSYCELSEVAAFSAFKHWLQTFSVIDPLQIHWLGHTCISTVPSITVQELIERTCSHSLATTRSAGCDSSDCLLCQYSKNCSYHTSTPAGRMCTLLHKRRWLAEAGNSSSENGSPCSDQISFSLYTDSSGDDVEVKRHRLSSGDSFNASSSRKQAAPSSLPRPWHWTPACDQLPDPAPAQLVELACLSANTEPGRARMSHDIICASEFSGDGRLLANGGVAKQIRLYQIGDELLDGQRTQHHAPAVVQRMPSKISTMAWSPDMDGVITIGDYDGVITQVHICSGHLLTDVDGHHERRIWSVVHSPHRPFLLASASDDKTVKLWEGRNLGGCLATLSPPGRQSSICGVDFSSAHEHLLALASSDHCVYLYDIRHWQAGPLQVLCHHQRPVSYVKFFGPQRIVSASTDATLALWDLHDMGFTNFNGTLNAQHSRPLPVNGKAPSGVKQGAWQQHATAGPRKVMSGHKNERNFVGLAVRPEDNLIACGSESTRVFIYNSSWSAPLASCEITPAASQGQAPPASQDAFVSSVCWQPYQAGQYLNLPPLLAAANSHGDLRLLALTQPADAL